jgi:hypothetical protein
MKINFLQFKNAFLITCLILSGSSILKAQINFQWASNMGSTGTDFGFAIATDASGNAYTTGYFSGTADFDPGAGTFTLTASGSNDIFISKLDINGNFVWAKKIGGTSNDIGRSIAIDGAGNINVTGSFQGSVDFDPNAGVTNLTSAGSNDIFIVKLTPAGNLVWAKNIGGANDDKGQSITADASGNVFTTGYFSGTADFDPAATTFTMNGLGGQESVFISKLDASGNFIWAKQFNGTTGSPQVFGNGISLDGSGNVYVGGSFTGTIDFDPSASTSTITAINMDIFIVKLDGSGNLVWVKTMGGASGSNTANSIAVDASNNVYATGYFDQTTDFDPSASTFNLTSTSGVDIFVLKLDGSGNFTWAKKMGSTSGDQGKSIAVSSTGDVYTTGYFSNINNDFDPGASTYTLNTTGGNTVFLSKLDASGNFVFANSYGGSSSIGWGLAVTSIFDIYTVGNFSQTNDFDPGTGTYTLNPNGGPGNDDAYVQKLGQSVCPTFSVNSSTSSFTLMCAITSLTLNAINTNSTASVTYTWTAPSSATTTGSSYVATVAGTYTISSSAPSSSCMVTQTLSIIQTTGNVNFNVNTTGSTCNNNGTATVSITGGTGPFTYTWSSGSNTTTASNLAPGTYSLTVEDANQCTKTNTFSIFNTAATFSSVPICFVTVDSLSQYNVITWDKTLFPTADSFFVYREIGTNNYQKICSQPYSTLSRFIDTVRTLYFPNTGDPNVGTYRYKMKVRDNCGNLSDYSPYHNTLFTINTTGTFSWSQLYTIEGDPNPVSAYILERDNLSAGNWAAVGSVSGTQSFIIDPNYATYVSTASWRVRTQWSISCVASQKTTVVSSLSYSNRIKNNAIGIKENAINNLVSIYPNPSNGVFTLKFNSNKKITTEIFNVTGEKIFSQESESLNPTIIDLSKNAAGIYFAMFRSDDKTITTKLIIQ